MVAFQTKTDLVDIRMKSIRVPWADALANPACCVQTLAGDHTIDICSYRIKFLVWIDSRSMG